MPIVRDEGGDSLLEVIAGAFGLQSSPPPSPSAPATLNGAPTVSSTPGPGQGVALDAAGRLPANIAARAVAVVTADPTSPMVGQMWYRSDTSQFCIRHDASTTKRVTLT